MRELIPHIGVFSKVLPLELYLDHSWLQKSREGLEIGNPEATYVAFSRRKHSLNARTYITREDCIPYLKIPGDG